MIDGVEGKRSDINDYIVDLYRFHWSEDHYFVTGIVGLRVRGKNRSIRLPAVVPKGDNFHIIW